MDNVEVKREPLSPPSSQKASAVKSGNRLPSFKPPRDLSLGGSGMGQPAPMIKGLLSLNKTNRKVYTPNVNIVRKKAQSIDTSLEVTNSSNSKDVKPNLKDKKNVTRNKPNYVQTQGIFSDGLAPSKVKAYQSSGSSSSSSEQPQLEKPKLNLNRTISKKNEDSKMKDLMKDDFIDDLKNGPDLSFIPLTLPRVYNVKSQDNDIKDIDKTFESFQIKAENIKKEEEELPDASEILEIFQKTDKPKLLLFEFPQLDTVQEEEVEDKKKSKTNTSDDTSSAPTKVFLN